MKKINKCLLQMLPRNRSLNNVDSSSKYVLNVGEEIPSPQQHVENAEAVS
jgi:hypothetical protein